MKKFFSILAAVLFAGNMMAQTNLINNGNFTDGTNGWTIKYQTLADTSIYAISATQGDFALTQSGKAGGRVDLYQDITIVPGTAYTLSFDYKESHAKFRCWSLFKSVNGVSVYNGDAAADDPLRTNNGYYEAATDWSTQSISFTAPAADTVTVFHLEFRYYKQEGNAAHLRNVSLVEGQPSALPMNATEQKAVKVIENGQVIILKNGVRYNAVGIKL